MPAQPLQQYPSGVIKKPSLLKANERIPQRVSMSSRVRQTHCVTHPASPTARMPIAAMTVLVQAGASLRTLKRCDHQRGQHKLPRSLMRTDVRHCDPPCVFHTLSLQRYRRIVFWPVPNLARCVSVALETSYLQGATDHHAGMIFI